MTYPSRRRRVCLLVNVKQPQESAQFTHHHHHKLAEQLSFIKQSNRRRRGLTPVRDGGKSHHFFLMKCSFLLSLPQRRVSLRLGFFSRDLSAASYSRRCREEALPQKWQEFSSTRGGFIRVYARSTLYHAYPSFAICFIFDEGETTFRHSMAQTSVHFSGNSYHSIRFTRNCQSFVRRPRYPCAGP